MESELRSTSIQSVHVGSLYLTTTKEICLYRYVTENTQWKKDYMSL